MTLRVLEENGISIHNEERQSSTFLMPTEGKRISIVDIVRARTCFVNTIRRTGSDRPSVTSRFTPPTTSIYRKGSSVISPPPHTAGAVNCQPDTFGLRKWLRMTMKLAYWDIRGVSLPLPTARPLSFFCSLVALCLLTDAGGRHAAHVADCAFTAAVCSNITFSPRSRVRACVYE